MTEASKLKDLPCKTLRKFLVAILVLVGNSKFFQIILLKKFLVTNQERENVTLKCFAASGGASGRDIIPPPPRQFLAL